MMKYYSLTMYISQRVQFIRVAPRGSHSTDSFRPRIPPDSSAAGPFRPRNIRSSADHERDQAGPGNLELACVVQNQSLLVL